MTDLQPVSETSIDGYGGNLTPWAEVPAVYRAHGWPVTAQDGAFHAEYSAPSAGPPPWNLYEVAPTKAFGLGTAEPYGATRWQF